MVESSGLYATLKALKIKLEQMSLSVGFRTYTTRPRPFHDSHYHQ